MTTKNDITGDLLKSKPASEQYRDNYDLIFRKKEKDNEQDNDNLRAKKENSE